MLSGELALEEAMDLSRDTLHNDDDDDDDDDDDNNYYNNTSTQYIKFMILFSVNIHLNSWVLP